MNSSTGKCKVLIYLVLHRKRSIIIIFRKVCKHFLKNTECRGIKYIYLLKEPFTFTLYMLLLYSLHVDSINWCNQLNTFVCNWSPLLACAICGHKNDLYSLLFKSFACTRFRPICQFSLISYSLHVESI